ncbi:MAG: hypothetical protein IJ809_00955 [Clostridia bacterium]|nr:hypothetical protein [Clostridia bacterium]
MVIFIQSFIYIVSILGIFLLFFILTDEEYYLAVKNDTKKAKILDIYTYNLDDNDVNDIISELEKSKKFEEVVDIVNIHERFDKK